MEFRTRGAKEIRKLRQHLPYCSFFHQGQFWANTHSHPTPRDPTTSAPTIQVEPTWISEGPRGSRHRLDKAPFSLWSDEVSDYTTPTESQAKWIFETYNATRVDWIVPFLVVTTSSPSLPDHGGLISLTLGCTPVIFVSQETTDSGFRAGPPQVNALHYVCTSMPDPLPFTSKPWTDPSDEEVKAILDHLQVSHGVHIQALNFIFPDLIIEILDDGKTYLPETLPARLGGWPVMYHYRTPGSTAFWDAPITMARQREISSPSSTQKGDDTNFLNIGNCMIGPGVRVEGSEKVSTAGVRIKKGEAVRITLANHSFEGCERVFHPDGHAGDWIGNITERFPDRDWALATLHPSISFSNNQIFECPTPASKLVMGQELKLREWYICDGVTTGKIALLYSGVRYLRSEDETNGIITMAELQPASVYFGRGPTGGDPEVKEGICGAAIVHELDGSVAGFLQFIDPRGYCFAPCLDKLIQEGWECY